MLYLALYFPKLPLEALSFPPSPSAVVRQGRILVADAESAAAGVVPGMRLASALGCIPELRIWQRQPALELAALETLAQWAGNFSPQVALATSQALLLEIGSCLRLFGGIEPLLASLHPSLGGMQHDYTWAVAPSALGALWLAQGRTACCCLNAAQASIALETLSVSVTGWPPAVLARLEEFGLPTLGDLRRLPDATLLSRLGRDVVEALQKAWGERPDPLAWYRFPEHFSMKMELPWKVEDSVALLFPTQRLLGALLGWLESRSGLLLRFRLQLGHGKSHEGGVCSHIVLSLVEPTRSLSRLVRLLRERFARLVLPAPVLSLELILETWSTDQHTRGLFTREQGEGALACLERLAVQLGAEHVYRLGLRADHRPEMAWEPLGVADCNAQPVVPVEEGAIPALGVPTRPAWLLPKPLPLRESSDGLWAMEGPVRQRPLQLLSAPERIESGWWDVEGVGDLRRDYFVAGCVTGERVWVFRDREGWFLHGLFA